LLGFACRLEILGQGDDIRTDVDAGPTGGDGLDHQGDEPVQEPEAPIIPRFLVLSFMRRSFVFSDAQRRGDVKTRSSGVATGQS
jgi:hypothetical protein